MNNDVVNVKHDEGTGCLVDGCLMDGLKFLGVALTLFAVAGCGLALLFQVIV